MIDMNKCFYNAGIRITRNCNLRCPYCNIPNSPSKDLPIGEWMKALDILKNMGIRDLVILGGEPTEYSDLVQFIKYAAKIGMRTSMTTNAVNNYQIIKDSINSGLNRIGVSVDTLDYKESISPYKCLKGLELLKMLLPHNQNCTIVDYVVLNSKNINDICNLIEFMTKNNVHTYLLPFHYGNEGKFEHRKNNNKYAFVSETDFANYCLTIDKIIKMKKDGFLIDNSFDFLAQSKKYIMNLDWKCNGLSEIRIDADGQMVCCCDKKGEVNKKYSIFDLANPTILDEFIADRNNEASNCLGCLWPSSFEAEIIKNKRER